MLRKLTGPGLFRLFLAMIVFVHHTTRLALGGSAVLIFFCLSGFWIYKMYIGRYTSTRQPYLTYIVSRAWRLLPTFWLVTAVTLLMLYFDGTIADYLIGPDRIHVLLSSLFLFGYAGLQMSPVGPAWSLDIEMQFYLIAPFLAVFLARRRVPIFWVLFTTAAVSLVSSFLRHPAFLTDYLAFFVIGMVAASINWVPSRRLVVASIGVALVMIACCLATRWREVLLIGTRPGPLSIYGPQANVLFALIALPYGIYTTAQEGFVTDGIFADLSYIIYLLHWPFVIWIGLHPGGVLHRLEVDSTVWVLVVGLSFVIWKFYDHPINRMRSRWVRARMKVKSAAAQSVSAAPTAS